MSKEEIVQELANINSSFVNDINAKLTDLFDRLTSLRQNIIKSILSCSSVKATTLIYLPG